MYDLEHKLGTATAQLSAQEAAGSLLRQWGEGQGVFASLASIVGNGNNGMGSDKKESGMDECVVTLARDLQHVTLGRLEVGQEADALKRYVLFFWFCG